jgi:hypothetical protein
MIESNQITTACGHSTLLDLDPIRGRVSQGQQA